MNTLWSRERHSITSLAIAVAFIFLMTVRAIVPSLNYRVTSDFGGRMVMNLQAVLDLLFLAGVIYGVWRAFNGLVPKFGEHFLKESFTVDFGGGETKGYTSRAEAEEAARSSFGAEFHYEPPQWTWYGACLVLRGAIGAFCWATLELLICGPRLWKAYASGATGETSAESDSNTGSFMIPVGFVSTLLLIWLLSFPVAVMNAWLIPKVNEAERTLYGSMIQPGKVYVGEFVDQEPHERVQLILKKDPHYGFSSKSDAWSLQAELKSLDHPERSGTYHIGVRLRLPKRIEFNGIYHSRPGEPKATGHDLAFSPHDYCHQTGRITDEGVIELTLDKSSAPWLRFAPAQSTP